MRARWRRIARLGDGGVDQHGVEAKFHCRRCMGRHANARIHHQRNIREMPAHGFERIRVIEAAARTDRRAPGHQHLAARFQQPFRDDEIVVHIGKTSNPSSQRMRAASTSPKGSGCSVS